MKSQHLRIDKLALSVVALAVLVPPAMLMAAPTLESIAAPTPLEKSDDVKAQPLLLLAKFPKAGPALARYVAQALAKQPSIFDAILSILPDTSPEQASAIGAGVVRALRTLAEKQPALVKEIVSKIARSNNLAFKTTFFAIGPRNPTMAEHYAMILPPETGLLAEEIGEKLPGNQGRLGSEPVSANGAGNILRNQEVHISDAEYFAHGTIVALISSNAASNGAVPTSPTH